LAKGGDDSRIKIKIAKGISIATELGKIIDL